MKWRDESPDTSLPRWPGKARTTLRVRTGEATARVVFAHLRGTDVERGGLLLGRAWSVCGGDADPCLISIDAAVPARLSTGTAVSVRIESAVWADASRALDAMRIGDPDVRVIGWYHSHPGIGAFFSATDRRTQRNWFAHAYSVGWVIDPVDGSHAAFRGAICEPVSVEIETGNNGKNLPDPGGLNS